MHGVVFNDSHTIFKVGITNFNCREGFGWTLFHYVIGQTVGRIFKALSSEAVYVESTIGRRRVYMKKTDAASFRELWEASMPASSTEVKTNLTVQEAETTPAVQESSEKVIEQIKAARASGQKVSLFIGRGAEQSVPHDGSFWVTLDIQPRSKTTTPTHPHLCMDFTVDQSRRSLAGLFDRVVVDFSVAKFLHSPTDFYKQFLLLLFPGDQAELIVEHTPLIEIKPGARPTYSVPFNHVTLPRADSEEFSSLWNNFTNETTNYLRRFFDVVELSEMPKHPCRGDDETSSGGRYWVLRSPKRRDGNA